MRYLFIFVFILLTAGTASAQTPCQGGTPTTPACSRNWAAGPLNVQACPATATSTDGVRVVLRELAGTPILSVTAGTPGGVVTLPTSSAPLASPTAPTRVVEFVCEDAAARKGASTFASITFPVLGVPVAPTLQ